MTTTIDPNVEALFAAHEKLRAALHGTPMYQWIFWTYFDPPHQAAHNYAFRREAADGRWHRVYSDYITSMYHRRGTEFRVDNRMDPPVEFDNIDAAIAYLLMVHDGR